MPNVQSPKRSGVVIPNSPQWYQRLAAFLIWLGAMKIWHYVSLASILAGWTLPAAVLGAGGQRPPLNWPLLSLSLLIAGLVTWRHRTNLQRIAAGIEPKAGRNPRHRS